MLTSNVRDRLKALEQIAIRLSGSSMIVERTTGKEIQSLVDEIITSSTSGMQIGTVLAVAKYYLELLTRSRVKAVQTTIPLERAAWCCSKIPDLVNEDRLDKAMRWLCFAQGVLFAKNVFTVGDLMVHSRGEVDLASLPEPIIKI